MIYHGALKPFENVLLRSPARAVELLRLQLLPQRLLVSVRGPATGGGGAGHEVGTVCFAITATGRS